MDLKFMIRRYRRVNFWFNVFKSYGRRLLQIQKIIFDSPVMSKINLQFLLIILIYDMIWVLLYLTNAAMIILREIVHESSCMYNLTDGSSNFHWECMSDFLISTIHMCSNSTTGITIWSLYPLITFCSAQHDSTMAEIERDLQLCICHPVLDVCMHTKCTSRWLSEACCPPAYERGCYFSIQSHLKEISKKSLSRRKHATMPHTSIFHTVQRMWIVTTLKSIADGSFIQQLFTKSASAATDIISTKHNTLRHFCSATPD